LSDLGLSLGQKLSFRTWLSEKGDSQMRDQGEKPKLLCVVCGKPTAKGNYCSECTDRGLGPCEACEGRSLLDVEEEMSS
jgi:hypothetical protein